MLAGRVFSLSICNSYRQTPLISNQARPFVSILKNKHLLIVKDVPSSLSRASSLLRRVGGAGVVIAFIQGTVVLYNYRSNPTLSVPPGLTRGLEEHVNVKNKENIVENKRFFSFSNASFSNFLHRKKENKDGHFISSKLFLQEPKEGMRFFRRIHDNWRSIINSGDGQSKSVLEGRDSYNIVVIGDSLACGIGCVNTRDKNEELSQIQRKENLSKEDQSNPLLNKGPVFPRSFARTLSRRMQRPIKWRSAGVNGGDVTDIRKHCVGIIEEEVNMGQTPDLVVVLCGMNDLKKIVSDPFRLDLTSDFRSNLIELIEAIKKQAPNTKIVFPAMPTQKFDMESVVNIFPLGFFLDPLVSLWDWQKKLVADLSPSSTMYFGMPIINVAAWYKRSDNETCIGSNTLIAADGVHPNSRCYSHWAEYMANEFCDRLGKLNKSCGNLEP